MPAVRRCPADLRDRVLETVVAAFATDPLLRWVWPEDQRYGGRARAFFGLLLDLRLEGGEVWVADEGAAVAMWDPPGGLYLPPAGDRWPAVQEQFSDVERNRWKIFESGMGIPDSAGPHWFLGVLATAPSRQRQGLGRKVVAPMLDATDRCRLPTYLETASERNVRFYRQLGFTATAEVELPDGPRCWLMRRDPQEAT